MLAFRRETRKQPRATPVAMHPARRVGMLVGSDIREECTMRRSLLARFLDELDCRGPGRLNRRRFLASVGGSAAAAVAVLPAYNAALAARRRAEAEHGPIRVEEIEVHKIQPRYHDWIHYELQHFYGPSSRVVYRAKTNNGLVPAVRTARAKKVSPAPTLSIMI